MPDKEENFTVSNEQRLDRFLAEVMDVSRNQVESLIKSGHVAVDNERTAKCGQKLKPGQKVAVFLPEPKTKKPQAVDFDVRIIYEDDDILVIDKPSGLTVHPAPSVKEATLVDWLRHKGISLSTLSGEERHGIVHRIDKETSGLLVVAKNNHAHLELSRQLQSKAMGRYYLALIDQPLKDDIQIDKPIGRNPKNRLKMAVVEGGRDAKTQFVKLATSLDGRCELIAAKLFTGRTHQIRVHLASINRHILGDSLYGFKSNKDTIKRVYLHAYRLYLLHPASKERASFASPLPEDMKAFLKENFDWESVNEKMAVDDFDSYFDGVF